MYYYRKKIQVLKEKLKLKIKRIQLKIVVYIIVIPHLKVNLNKTLQRIKLSMSWIRR